MKKLALGVGALLFCAASMFALDAGNFPKGTWQDTKWNANWVFGVESIQLFDSATNTLIFDFSDDKITDYKLTPSTKGLTMSFTCAETHRSYKFTKPVTVDTSLNMEIDPDWTSENYSVTLPFKK